MVQKILSDKVMNERTNAYYSYYLGERNISVLPLNAVSYTHLTLPTT